MLNYLAIFAAGLLAGAINALAGGGTLLTFPVLVWAGRDPIVANATNALALWPGSLAGAFALRREARENAQLLRALLPVSALGGFVGGWVLLITPTRLFSAVVPGLVLLATVLLAVRPKLTAWLQRRATPGAQPRLFALCAAQLAVALYGGYFGAAMGILMLASLGLFGIADIHARNAVKNVLASVINGAAGVYFVASGAIAWLDFALLAVSAVLGGYVGARAGRRLPPAQVERGVLVFGLIASALLAARALR